MAHAYAERAIVGNSATSRSTPNSDTRIAWPTPPRTRKSSDTRIAWPTPPRTRKSSDTRIGANADAESAMAGVPESESTANPRPALDAPASRRLRLSVIPLYLCPRPESNWRHADFQTGQGSSLKQGDSAQACQSADPSRESGDTDVTQRATAETDNAASSGPSSGDRASVLRSLYVHASELVAAGDLEGAKLLHDTIGRMLDKSSGVHVVDLATERERRNPRGRNG